VQQAMTDEILSQYQIAKSFDRSQWYCYRLKVTENLTLMIGINSEDLMIRVRGVGGTIKTIEGHLVQCTSGRPVEQGEVFNDM
jgi:hypothetical protein